MLAFVACLAGCTTPMQYGASGQQAADRDTQYSVTDTDQGFVLSLTYERYQFIPETSAVMQACRSQLLATAYKVAEQKGRPIAPVNEQRIQISTGRNGLTGMTSCAASVPVSWQTAPR